LEENFYKPFAVCYFHVKFQYHFCISAKPSNKTASTSSAATVKSQSSQNPALASLPVQVKIKQT